jgi:hypothetical protein
MPRHHDYTEPIPRFSGIHPYLNNPYPEWKGAPHPETLDTYLDVQVGDIVTTSFQNGLDTPNAPLIYCEVLEIGPVEFSPPALAGLVGEDPRNWPLQVKLRPLPGQTWWREADLYQTWPEQMSLEWVRGVVRPVDQYVQLPLD